MGIKKMTDTDNYKNIADSLRAADRKNPSTNSEKYSPNEMSTEIDKLVNLIKGTIDGSITSVTIPYGVTTIWNNALRNLVDLTEVRIPETVTIIKDGAFCYDTALRQLNFPPNLAQINATAFQGCTGMRIYSFFLAQQVPRLGNVNAFNNAFEDANAKIIVPDALYDDWIVAQNWSDSSIVSHIVKYSDYHSV